MPRDERLYEAWCRYQQLCARGNVFLRRIGVNEDDIPDIPPIPFEAYSHFTEEEAMRDLMELLGGTGGGDTALP